MSFGILFLVGLTGVSIAVTTTLLAIWFAKRSKPDEPDIRGKWSRPDGRYRDASDADREDGWYSVPDYKCLDCVA